MFVPLAQRTANSNTVHIVNMYARQEISNNRNFVLLPYENTICVILSGLEHLKVFVAITLYRDERQKKNHNFSEKHFIRSQKRENFSL